MWVVGWVNAMVNSHRIPNFSTFFFFVHVRSLLLLFYFLIFHRHQHTHTYPCMTSTLSLPSPQPIVLHRSALHLDADKRRAACKNLKKSNAPPRTLIIRIFTYITSTAWPTTNNIIWMKKAAVYCEKRMQK